MHILAATVLAATSKTPKPSSNGVASLIFIVIIGLAGYFLLIRPRSAAARRQRETLQELVPGDEVLTTAGIFGTVLDVAPDRVTIETAPGTRLTVLRSAIVRRTTLDAGTSADEWDAEDGDPDPDDEGDGVEEEHSEAGDGHGASGTASDNGHGPGVHEPVDPKDGEAGS